MKKYPVLYVDSIPHGFKHCEIGVIVGFDFQNPERFITGDEATMKKAYIEFIIKESVQLLDGLMTLFRPQILKSKDKSYVILKDNVEMYRLKDTIQKLIVEMDHYTNKCIGVKANYSIAMVMINGKDPTMFKTNKVGEFLEESEVYQSNEILPTQKFNPQDLSYITPYAEYKVVYGKKDS